MPNESLVDVDFKAFEDKHNNEIAYMEIIDDKKLDISTVMYHMYNGEIISIDYIKD